LCKELSLQINFIIEKMVAETSESMNAELDNSMDCKIKKTYSSSSKRSTTSKSFKKPRSFLNKSKFSANSTEARDQKEVASHEEDNAEKRENSGMKIDLRSIDLQEDERDRICFNHTISTDGNESDVRYSLVDDGSVGYDDAGGGGCCKIPYFCKFNQQGTFSIDEDSQFERYNTYDETYQQVMTKKQEKKRNDIYAATLKAVKVESNTNQIERKIELPCEPKTFEKVIADVERKPVNDLLESSTVISMETVSTLTRTDDTPLPISRTHSALSENNEIDDATSVASKRSLKQESISHILSAAKEKLEKEAQVKTIDDTPFNLDDAEEELEEVKEEDAPAPTKARNIKKKGTKNKKNKNSFFKKRKKSSTKKEDTKNKKKKKGLFSFLKKSHAKKDNTKSKKNEDLKEGMKKRHKRRP